MSITTWSLEDPKIADLEVMDPFWAYAVIGSHDSSKRSQISRKISK